MLGNLLSDTEHSVLRVATFRPRIAHDPIEPLPEHNGSARAGQGLEKLRPALCRREPFQPPIVVARDRVEIPAPYLDPASRRRPRRDGESAALAQRCGLQAKTEASEIF